MYLDPVEDAHHYLDRLSRKEDALSAAAQSLMSDALTALTEAPHTMLQTPKSHDSMHKTCAATVFSDYLTGDADPAKVLAILRMLDAGQGGTASARLQAQAILSDCARKYADFYCDMVAED